MQQKCFIIFSSFSLHLYDLTDAAMKWNKILKTTAKTALWIAGIWIALLVILEVVLSQSVLTGLVNRYASEYVDGDLRFGRISASMFRRFPSATLTLEDFSITYPADRFDAQEKEGAQSFMTYRGCGQDSDTLASFKRFSASVNLPALLTGTISIPHVRLDRPRVFAHFYADGSSNTDIFRSGTEESAEPEDTAKTAIPKIVLGRIAMTGRPHIVYTDSRDTVFAMVNIKRLGFKGKLNTRRVSRSKVGLTLDSMLVAGRLGRDTMSAGLDRLYVHEDDGHVDVNAAAKAYVASNAFGRLMVPVDIDGMLDLDENVLKAEDFNVSVAYIPITAEAEVTFEEGRTYVKGKAAIKQCKVATLLDKYADNFMPGLKGFETDATVSLQASCKGFYDHKTGSLPGFTADISRLEATANGLDLMLKGRISDTFGKDPVIDVDGGLFADLDSLAHFIPDSLGIHASGALEAHINGNAKLSQLNLYKFSESSIKGEVLGEGVSIQMPADTVNAFIDGLKIVLGPEVITSRRDPSKSFKLMGVTGEIAETDITYKGALALKMSDFRIAAKNVMESEVAVDSTVIHPFGGSISASRLSLKDSEGSSVRLDSTWNGFQIFPKKDQNVPVLTLTSRNGRIFLRSDVNRAMMSRADIRATAVLNTVERRQKMRAFRDSLSRVYPDVPKDSLFRHMMAQRGPRPQMPEWMKEEDFRKQDIDISLDKTLAKYFRDWDLKGNINVGRGMVMTPYFPLRNTLQGFDLRFTNDRVTIEKFDIQSGNSKISATGELTGLKRALLGRRGSLKLDAEVRSDGMNANQLLAAYTKGSKFNPETFTGKEDISDEAFMEQVVLDSVSVSEAPSLLVVPANLNADIRLDASNIRYSDLHINKVTAGLVMKERCVQITDTKALTNMGDINMEGFYATRSKKDLKAGFNINFKDITAEKVISLMPAIDTIMPLLKSFGGLLNCEIAATTQLDTNMNLIMPSIDGVMRIGGDNLTISNNDMFKSMAKMLLFRNKKEGRIDKMTVEGMIKDSKLEIFPFILEMDRYTLGLSGVQNMDMSFRYHASLIRSPFLIKLGVDLYGPDFDNMKFKLGKAKYKNRNMPVFSTVIDETKVNLVESIRNIFDKGVDAAFLDNSKQSAIEEHKKKIGYVQAVDQKMEELSEDEQKQLEEHEQSGVH